jgi:hypothetical protein
MSEDSTSTPAFEKELFPLSPPLSPVGHHFTLTLLLKSTQLHNRQGNGVLTYQTKLITVRKNILCNSENNNFTVQSKDIITRSKLSIISLLEKREEFA